MSNQSTILSVVMPFKDRLDHAIASINSVLNQTLKEFELIIVDDGSSSECLIFLETLCSRYDHVRLIKNEGVSGACACRNIGLDNSSGEFVLFLDSDDILAPFALHDRVVAMRARPDLDYIANVCLLYRARPFDRYIVWNRKNDRGQLDNFLRHNAPFQTSGPLWRKSSLDRLSLRWDEGLVGWQDWKFHVEALLSGAKGEVTETIDYFWNQPKTDSISRSSHDFDGRVNRMRRLSDFAQCQDDLILKNRIKASVVWLAFRMNRKDKLRVCAVLWSLLKGTDYRLHAIMYVYFKSKKLSFLRGIGVLFKQRLKRDIPVLFDMIYASNTYKLSVEQKNLELLINKLDEHSDFQKAFW